MFRKVLYEAGKETFAEYLKKTSLNGCRLLYTIRRRKYERLVWFMFIVVTVVFAYYVCSTILRNFSTSPIATTLDPLTYTIYEAPFPSVAVCSHNKFSRRALWKYASNITARSKKNQTLTYWIKRLEMLSGLYNYDSINSDESDRLHIELEEILDEVFVTSNILKMLAPKCDDLLMKCFWAGSRISCKKQFEFKIFIDGPCCVFNYQHKKDLESLYYPIGTGADNGLAFIVNSSTNDYFYAENSAFGFYVKLFSTQFIPDSRLSNTREFHVGAAEDVVVSLRLSSTVTSENTRVYDVSERHCHFPSEQGQPTLERSECILNCYADKIGEACECIPFYAVNTDIGHYSYGSELFTECALINIRCLKFYKYEYLNSAECRMCYPRCSFHNYELNKAVYPLNTTLGSYTNLNYLPATANISSAVSLVKIFYPSEDAVRYNKNVVYAWHHILSQIGGVLGICVGCSIITGIEWIYFGSFRLIENFLRFKSLQNQISN